MKKLMLGLAAAGLGALLSLGGANAQDGRGQTGMGADAGAKGAPTSMTMGKRGGMGMMKMRRHKHMRHHRRHM